MTGIVISLPADADATQIVDGLGIATSWRVADVYHANKLYKRLSVVRKLASDA